MNNNLLMIIETLTSCGQTVPEETMAELKAIPYNKAIYCMQCACRNIARQYNRHIASRKGV